MKDNDGNLLGESEQIKQHLQINRTKESITSELLASLEKPTALFSSKGPCSAINLQPYPDNYFVAQEFNQNKDDLRTSIEYALADFGFSSIRADDFYLSDTLICKIAGLIKSTPFGVYQLSKNQNRNVYLELGIAIGLGRSFVLIKDKDADPARIIQDIEYYQINNYLDVRYGLGRLLEKYIASIGRIILDKPPSDIVSDMAVIYHGDVESIDITVTLAQQVKSNGFNPVILGAFRKDLADYIKREVGIKPIFIESREQIINAIHTSRFGIYRTNQSASPDNFVALGVSIGINKPFLPIKHMIAEDGMPADLKYLSPLEYAGYTDLGKKFEFYFPNWLLSIEN